MHGFFDVEMKRNTAHFAMLVMLKTLIFASRKYDSGFEDSPFSLCFT
jgi:hypothetical protein